MKTVDLNSDLGESFGMWQMGKVAQPSFGNSASD